MRQMLAGAVVVVAGIAAFIEAGSHHPEAHHPLPSDFGGPNVLGRLTLTSPATGWSQTAYDLVRIGAWALVIFGALLVIIGLIRYWRQPSR
jgi:hypothetical protein